jgi:hypothetical protein
MYNYFFEKNQKIQDFIDKTNFFLGILPFQPLGSFSHMAKSRSSSKITRKMNLVQEKQNKS